MRKITKDYQEQIIINAKLNNVTGLAILVSNLLEKHCHKDDVQNDEKDAQNE